MYSVEFRYKGHEKDFIISQNLFYIKNRNKIIFLLSKLVNTDCLKFRF